MQKEINEYLQEQKNLEDDLANYAQSKDSKSHHIGASNAYHKVIQKLSTMSDGWVKREITPNHGEWYIVCCPNYCESSFCSAEWNLYKSSWITETGDDITNYVVAFFELPKLASKS